MDMDAYEQCRSVFSGPAGGLCGKQAFTSGMVVLLQKGVFAWLQHRNTGKSTHPPTDIPLRHQAADMRADELVTLLASLMGGHGYESEF